ncbi:MAG: septal ring lytic transglycosylase RlpA family protein [Deltaproteobacteria bacterium]|nr:septal ring lytic transglycosylase RlpA family protein [Deltaproteobacteria bacterium]
MERVPAPHQRHPIFARLILLCACALLPICTSCATRAPCVKAEKQGSYTINGKTYKTMKTVKSGHKETGVASWYGPGFDGKKTACGERYDMHAMTAAHPSLPMNTLVRVTNLANGRATVVRINDRGPFVDDRLIDLSLAAARELKIVRPGLASVQLDVIGSSGAMVASKGRSISNTPDPTRAPNPFYQAATQGSKPESAAPASLGRRLVASLWSF